MELHEDQIFHVARLISPRTCGSIAESDPRQRHFAVSTRVRAKGRIPPTVLIRWPGRQGRGRGRWIDLAKPTQLRTGDDHVRHRTLQGAAPGSAPSSMKRMSAIFAAPSARSGTAISHPAGAGRHVCGRCSPSWGRVSSSWPVTTSRRIRHLYSGRPGLWDHAVVGPGTAVRWLYNHRLISYKATHWFFRGANALERRADGLIAGKN